MIVRVREHLPGNLRAWLLPLVISVLTAAGAYLLFKPRHRMAPSVPILARAAQENAAALVSDGKAWAARLDSKADRRRAADQFLRAAPEHAADLLGDETLRSAFTTLYEFSAAIGAEDPDAYASWAESRGQRRRDAWPVAAGRDEAFYRRVYADLLGVEPPPNLGPERFFTDLFRLRAGADAARPVAMLMGDAVVEIDLTTFTHPADTFDYLDPVHENGLGVDFWLGGSSGAGIRLWDPPRSLAEILKAHAAAPAMRVRYVLESAGGAYLIFIVELIYDPGREQWHVHRLWQQNFKTVLPDRVPPPVY